MVYYLYDAVGNLINLEYPDGQWSYFGYDDAQRMITFVSAENHAGGFGYDKSSNIVKKEFGNGVTAALSYDQAERVKEIIHFKPGSTVASVNYYQWDAGIRITSIRKITQIDDYKVEYGYDKNDRLTSEVWLDSDDDQAWGFFYWYDAAGNRLLQRKEHGAGVEWQSAYYVYNDDNSLMQCHNIPSQTTTYYTYDPNGALIQMDDNGAVTHFNYGPNQLITGITPPVGDAWTCDYDGQLNRYKTTLGGTDYYHLWDGLNRLETRDSDGNPVARYSYAYAPIYGIGSCVEIWLASTDSTYTLAFDHRGTGRVLFDHSGNEVGWRLYNAFGELIQQTGDWPVDLGYQTNWQTVKIGQKWWGLSAARVYDFATGRFISRDPIGFTGSQWNL